MGKKNKNDLGKPKSDKLEIVMIVSLIIVFLLVVTWWKKQWLGLLMGFLVQGGIVYIYNKVK